MGGGFIQKEQYKLLLLKALTLVARLGAAERVLGQIAVWGRGQLVVGEVAQLACLVVGHVLRVERGVLDARTVAVEVPTLLSTGCKNRQEKTITQTNKQKTQDE